ncbi:MAG: glycine--tRNA ligase subunit alpha, partial [Hyphomicrobium denitrificans]|nr:glycine--tRNA ligase subunit alpha [Hyphomicrobium denitrificans]
MSTTTVSTKAARPSALRPRQAFQDLILTLQTFWSNQGCAILQP